MSLVDKSLEEANAIINEFECWPAFTEYTKEQYQEALKFREKMSGLDDTIKWLKKAAIALAILAVLQRYFKMLKHGKQHHTPHSRSVVVHTADDLEHGRHKHDGSQPTAESARPGHHANIEWPTR